MGLCLNAFRKEYLQERLVRSISLVGQDLETPQSSIQVFSHIACTELHHSTGTRAYVRYNVTFQQNESAPPGCACGGVCACADKGGIHMAQILVENLVKTFRVAERGPGTLGRLARAGRTGDVPHGATPWTASRSRSSRASWSATSAPTARASRTTVKMLSGILVPDGGRVEVARPHAVEAARRSTSRRIGVVFGQRTQLWWDLPVIESFDLLRDIYRVPRRPTTAQTRDELVALLDLEPLLDTPVRQLSLGQRMRCDLAAALLHAPPILFLDEPTIGLDAVSKLAVRDFVRASTASAASP